MKPMKNSFAAIVFMVVVLLAADTALGAAERHPHVGKLPGYPAIRGVMPVLGSHVSVAAHEALVSSAFAAAKSAYLSERHLFHSGAPVPNEVGEPPCLGREEELRSLETQDVCYRGGPVVRDPKIHLIFWQGNPGASGETKVKAFPSGYEATVTSYFENVARDSGLETNVFAVQPQYGEILEDGFAAGQYALNQEVEVIKDTTSFLPSKCEDKTKFSEGPCVLDSDIQKTVETYAGSQPVGLKDIYVVLTPEGVGSCFHEGECAYQLYCAYHGDFGGEGTINSKQTLYANLPFVGKVEGCDSGVHPNSLSDNGADAVIDVASHEINETISDPIGSQCAEGATEVSECEPTSWTDAIGQEIADKCLPPESTVDGRYGVPLGGTAGAKDLYNQVINGSHYFTQRLWSNEAGLFEGACVQRRIGVGFTVPSTRQATVPMTLDGASSGAPGDPSVYWVWNFGNGEQIGTASPTISHTFAQPGEYAVGLTAYDAFGNSEAGVGTFGVGAAPTPPVPPPAPAPQVIRIAPAAYTAAQLATKLGLPANGKKLSGNGPFSLGHAECPPACGVTLQMFAKTTTTANKHTTTKLVLIGSAHLRLAAKGAHSLSLSLNTKGKQLLHKLHKLNCKLVVSVEGQEGGSWQITRSLALKG
jgi:hypothetical protein